MFLLVLLIKNLNFYEKVLHLPGVSWQPTFSWLPVTASVCLFSIIFLFTTMSTNSSVSLKLKLGPRWRFSFGLSLYKMRLGMFIYFNKKLYGSTFSVICIVIYLFVTIIIIFVPWFNYLIWYITLKYANFGLTAYNFEFNFFLLCSNFISIIFWSVKCWQTKLKLKM